VAQLCQRQGELEHLNTDVLIVSFGTQVLAHAWLQETCSPFRLLLDSERAVYRAYGLERSFWHSWNLRTMWRYVRLMAAGREWRGIQGDSTQLGGDFIIAKDGILQLAYRSHDPTDRPSVATLLTILGQLEKETENGLYQERSGKQIEPGAILAGLAGAGSGRAKSLL